MAAGRHDTMMNPPIEGLLAAAGEGLGAIIPPQVTSVARKPLSIAFEEVAAGKIVPIEPDPELEGESAEGKPAE